MAEIASRTGFSKTTISRVLSGQSDKYRISKKTCEAIVKEAKKCHYTKHLSAQRLREIESSTIGLLLPSLANLFFAELADVIIEELNKAGYFTVLMDTMENEDKFRESVQTLASRRVRGIIAVPCDGGIPVLEEIDANGTPVVLIDRSHNESALSYVTTNNYQGSKKATEELIQKGHRRIACLQGKDSSTNRDRVAGYRDAMQAAGLGEQIMTVGNEFTIQNGYLETKLLLAMDPSTRPSAIFSLSNMIALGAIKAINEAGLNIPEDIALLTFDNNTYLDFMQPSLTRIAQATGDMGILAVKLLLDRINHNTLTKTTLILTPTLIKGDSV